MAARARMLGGERLGFEEEAQALYDVVPPRFTETQLDSLLGRLDSLLPGGGPLAARYQRFRNRLMIPATRVDTVFKTPSPPAGVARRPTLRCPRASGSTWS